MLVSSKTRPSVSIKQFNRLVLLVYRMADITRVVPNSTIADAFEYAFRSEGVSQTFSRGNRDR